MAGPADLPDVQPGSRTSPPLPPVAEVPAPFPRVVAIAAAVWIVFGCLALLGNGLQLLLLLLLARDADSILSVIALVGALVVAAVFLNVGVKSLKGTAGDTLGNGVGSIAFGLLGLGWGVSNLVGSASGASSSFIGVLGALNGTILIVAGGMALIGRSRYRVWRERGRSQFPWTPRIRGWVWIYVVLAVLAAAAIVIPLVVMPIVYSQQQLKLEELEASRELWEKNGPKNYRLQYTKRGSTGGTFVVWVKDDQVQAVLMKQDEDQDDRSALRLPRRQFPYYGMRALFDDIERFLEMNAPPPGSTAPQGPPRAHIVAAFNPDDGHLTYFLRAVRGTREQLEITHIQLQPLPAGEPLPAFLRQGADEPQ